jgi:hypothetical protein
MMHKVRMLKTVPGSYDGFTPVTWHRGHVYDDISDSLLRSFIQMGACELVTDDLEIKPEPAVKRKRGHAL